MGLFSFGNKNDAPRRRGANARSAGGEPRRRRRTEGSDEASAKDTGYGADAMLLDPTLPEKQRARRRLVGAIALVIAAVVVLPMVLDSHPKPVTDDIAIDIPSRPANVPSRAKDDSAATQAGVAPDSASGLAAAGVTPLASNADAGTAPPLAKPAKPAQSATQSANSTKPSGTPQQPATQTTQAHALPAPRTPSSPQTKPKAQTQAAKPSPSPADADSGTPAAPLGARFAVQLGVFPDDASARQWERKLKAAGVPAYVENRKQADGSTRVLLRAGPFPDRAAASAAVAKVRESGLMSNAAQ